LLDALDGIDRPAKGPITVALTTLGLDDLDEGAVRPGRLAPRLILEKPTADERRLLLSRLVDGLPIKGELDLESVVDRTGGWSGAELAGAIQDACSRSLLDRTDALRQDHLLEVVAERYNILDEIEDTDWDALERIALHEAGHVLYAWLTYPGGLASVKLYGHHGQTMLRDSAMHQVPDAQGLRRHAELSLAGAAAELVCRGKEWVTEGGHRDKEEATEYLLRLLAIRKPYAVGPLEAGNMSDHGSERLRAGWHAELEAMATEAQDAAVRWLAPHQDALLSLARLILDAPEHSLSGDALEAAIERVLPGAVSTLYGDVG
jgi:ATP-dependent Zn protease